LEQTCIVPLATPLHAISQWLEPFVSDKGAMPCMGILTVEDYLAALQGFDVREVPA
jgi:hypothetical protein